MQLLKWFLSNLRRLGDGMFPCKYEILVSGRIPEQWLVWFEAFQVSHPEEGVTRLAGDITDSSTLYGMIARCRDLGLVILRLEKMNAEP